MTKYVGKKIRMEQMVEKDRMCGVTVVAIHKGDLEMLAPQTFLKVRGTSKGHGFQGVVKRHGFHGGPRTHGQKNRHRAPGSIGNTTPQRVIPGRRMAGHMGAVHVTVRNMRVADVDKEKKMVRLHGAVPGSRGGIVEMTPESR